MGRRKSTMGPSAQEERRNSLFHGMVWRLADKVGRSASAVVDLLIGEFCPRTAAIARQEGVFSDLRLGLKVRVEQVLRTTQSEKSGQKTFNDIHPDLMPIVAQLNTAAFYVPSDQEWIPIADLCHDAPRLKEAWDFMSLKADETAETARILGQLYTAVIALESV